MAALRTETIIDLTTIFTPPTDCANSWTYEAEFYNSIPSGLFIQNADGIDTSCFPPSFGGSGRAPSSIQVYSPGWCPDGYATPGQFQNGGTTTAICCPSDFSYGSTYSTINFFDSSSVLFMGCISSFSGTTTVSARGNSSMIPVIGSDITLWAQPISVEYEADDLSLFSVSTSATATGDDGTTSGGGISNTATLPSNTATAPGAQQTNGTDPNTNADTNTDGSTSEDAGLSTGAIAGIAVGAAALALAGLAGLVFFIMRKRRAARRRAELDGTGKVGGAWGKDSKEPYREQQPPVTWERRELDAGPGSEYRPELDGGDNGGNGGERGGRGGGVGGMGGGGVRPKQAPGQVSELE